jgi:hypothetical protein
MVFGITCNSEAIVSFRGATFGARGQRGMRTFRGPEEDVGEDFDVGPAPDAQ